MSYLYFVNNTLEYPYTSRYDVAFHVNWLGYNNTDRRKFTFSYSTNEHTENRVVQCTTDDDRCTNATSFGDCLQTLDPAPLIPIYVDSSWKADDTCGKETNGEQCKTLNYSFSVAKFKFRPGFVICENGSVETIINVGDNLIDITSKDNNDYVIKSNPDNDSLILINSGRFKAMHLTFFHDPSTSSQAKLVNIEGNGGRCYFERYTLTFTDDETDDVTIPLTVQLLDMSNGTLSLVGIKFINILFDSCYLFVIPSSTSFVLTLNGTSFVNVKRQNRDSGILSHTLADGQNFAMSNMSFERCATLKGDGGAMYVEVNNGGHLKVGDSTQSTLFTSCISNGDGDQGGRGGGICLRIEIENGFVLENLFFTGCYTDVAGHNLYIYSTKLNDIINKELIKFTMTAPPSNWMDSPDGTGSDSISLPFITKVWSGHAYVSKSEGAEVKYYCGFIDFPWESISYAASNRFSNKSEKAEIYLLDEFRFVDKIDCKDQIFNITGPGEGKDVGVGGEGIDSVITGYLIGTSVELTITNISFYLVETFGSFNGFLYVSSDTVVISECNMSFVEENGKSLGYSFYCIGGGLPDIKNMNVKGKTMIVTLTKSLIIINSGGNLNMNGGDGSNISLNDNNGSFIHGQMGNGNSVNVVSVHFENCYWKNGSIEYSGYGGVMWFNLSLQIRWISVQQLLMDARVKSEIIII